MRSSGVRGSCKVRRTSGGDGLHAEGRGWKGIHTYIPIVWYYGRAAGEAAGMVGRDKQTRERPRREIHTYIHTYIHPTLITKEGPS
eukprot:2428544-Heterocapsa_arctica.AAC.1